MPRRLLVPLLASLSILAVPASASAAVNIRVGVGDQNPSMFSNQSYKDLKLKLTRYFIEWNAIDQPREIQEADAFVTAARQNGVKVLMHISADDVKSKPRKPLPSVSKYRTKVRKLIRRYKPMGVKEWGAWNEANHHTQPTDKKPKRAAQFFKTMRSICNGCRIVALDVLDERGVESYIRSFYRHLGGSRSRAKIIGIHNYSEVNRKRTRGTRQFPGTKRIIDAARERNRSAKFWYTETGGLVTLGASFPCDPTRAADRTSFMFSRAKKYRRFVQRLYTYNWSPTASCGGDGTGFDAGLVNPDGTPRPAYAVFKSKLKDFKR